jgi:hypothetical protein
MRASRSGWDRWPMLASAPFPHLDALQALFDRAAGLPTAPVAGCGRSLFPMPFVTAGSLAWPAQHAHRVLHEWARWTREVPHDVTSVARLVQLPRLQVVPAELRGRSLVVIEVAIPREPWVAAGRLAPLRRLLPELDTVAVVDPDALPALHTEVAVPAPALAEHMPLSALPGSLIDAFVAIAGPASGSHLLTASLRHLGPAYGTAAAGIPVDEEDAELTQIRLELLASRLAGYAAGRQSLTDLLARVAVRRGVLQG